MSSSTQQQSSAFRAPPPSPIATGQGIRAAGVNTEILSEFLEHQLQIPELNLPEPLFRPEVRHKGLPAFDLVSLRCGAEGRRSTGRELLQTAIEFGCFQVVNHGISRELTERAEEQCVRLFDLPADKKQSICRFDESRIGFERIAGDANNGKKKHETFWVDRNEESAEKAMRNVWPEGFRNFSWAMSEFSAALENIASEILEILYENLNLDPSNLKELLGPENSSVLCLYSHHGPYKSPSARLRHSHSHVLSVHHHMGSSGFYVYADHGWTTVDLIPNSIVITVGNIFKVWSTGLVKSVIGRPITSGDRHFISMEFLYTPPSKICGPRSVGKVVKVSLADQFLVVIILLLIWRFLSYL